MAGDGSAAGRVGLVRSGSGRRALGQLLDGSWRELSVSPLVLAAAGSVLLDAATTSVVFLSPSYAERNVVLSSLAEVHVLVAIGWLLCTSGVFVLVTALSLGWISTVAGTLTVCTNGLLGVNNLVLFATGTALFSMGGVDVGIAVHLLTPLLGITAGLALEYSRHGLPWPEAIVGSAAYFAVDVFVISLL